MPENELSEKLGLDSTNFKTQIIPLAREIRDLREIVGGLGTDLKEVMAGLCADLKTSMKVIAGLGAVVAGVMVPKDSDATGELVDMSKQHLDPPGNRESTEIEI